VVGEGGLRFEEGHLMKKVHVFHDATLKIRIAELLIGGVFSIYQKFLNAVSCICSDDAGGQFTFRQRCNYPVFHFSIETVGKSFEDEEGLLVDIDCIGDVSKSAKLF
jgi:hypothetical protein